MSIEHQLSDEELLKRIANKEMTAIEQLYRRHENALYRFALTKLGNEADAADIVNTVLIEVWNTALRFEFRSKVSTWMFGIANHRIIDLLRKRRADHEDDFSLVDISDSAPEMTAVLSAAQDKATLNYCLSKLKPEHKQAIELLFFRDCSYEEIGEIMDCAKGTIKSRVHHAKLTLKECLSRRLGAM